MERVNQYPACLYAAVHIEPTNYIAFKPIRTVSQFTYITIDIYQTALMFTKDIRVPDIKWIFQFFFKNRKYSTGLLHNKLKLNKHKKLST